MKTRKALYNVIMLIGIILIVYSPVFANKVELRSIYEDNMRSYFTYMAYTISTSVLGLAIFIYGVIGYFMTDKM
ncbi:hypothetical protein [Clostridium thermarum]|uniref:hypothetical protein n=1 Tax=Clostridium thermarum TaxID=1716543 RepID=UPI0013D88BE2|nr:hypothetical protein [Clostridium thermarum]